MQIITRKS